MPDDDMIAMVLDDAREKMAKAVEHARAEFTSVRTGRAAPALVEKLPVDYYGTEVPLQQIAGFTVPEARLLVISPYDKGAMSAIEKAIQNSRLGLSPSNDGQVIRLQIPALTEERRIARGDLARAIRERQAKNPQQPVLIAADKDVRYEAVLQVMDELHKQQVRRVGLLVKPAK